ncbi:hypothetical protein COO60DRAFT_58377 [Scenedesmus sp. NREL 46B-D3]|nr:hypothetical protein COO60DRAFT_58377 [Scenedesmus sp. NREL 46B-D3]
MERHRLLAAVKQRWPHDHGPEFVKQQIASFLVEGADAVGCQVGLPALGVKLCTRLGTDWREQHGLQQSTTLRKLLEKEGCFEFIMQPNSNVANAVRLDVDAMLQGIGAHAGAAPGAAPLSPQASAAAGPSARAAGAACNVRIVPRPSAVKGGPKAVPASVGPEAGGHSSYSSNGLLNLPDTLDSPPPVKLTRTAPKAPNQAAATKGGSGSMVNPSGRGVAAVSILSRALANGSGSGVSRANGGAAAGASNHEGAESAGGMELSLRIMPGRCSGGSLKRMPGRCTCTRSRKPTDCCRALWPTCCTEQ